MQFCFRRLPTKTDCFVKRALSLDNKLIRRVIHRLRVSGWDLITNLDGTEAVAPKGYHIVQADAGKLQVGIFNVESIWKSVTIVTFRPVWRMESGDHLDDTEVRPEVHPEVSEYKWASFSVWTKLSLLISRCNLNEETWGGN